EAASKDLRLDEFAHANSNSCDLVLISRTDASRGGADFVLTARFFLKPVEHEMVRKNHVGGAADLQIAELSLDRLGAFQFREQTLRTDHHPAAQNCGHMRMQNTCR